MSKIFFFNFNLILIITWPSLVNNSVEKEAAPTKGSRKKWQSQKAVQKSVDDDDEKEADK